VPHFGHVHQISVSVYPVGLAFFVIGLITCLQHQIAAAASPSSDHRHRHHPEQPERRRDDPEQEPSGEPEESHTTAPISIAAIAWKIGYACWGTTALPRHLSRSTRDPISFGRSFCPIRLSSSRCRSCASSNGLE